MKRTVEDPSAAEKTTLEQKPEVEELKPEDQWIPGKPAPEGAKNPPPGAPGHRCLDPDGKYQPTWFSVHIDRGPTVPAQQYFASNGGGYRVRTGEWVDVPPEIVEVMRSCTYIDTRTTVVNTTEGPKRQNQSVEVPRFSFSALPSA